MIDINFKVVKQDIKLLLAHLIIICISILKGTLGGFNKLASKLISINASIISDRLEGFDSLATILGVGVYVFLLIYFVAMILYIIITQSLHLIGNLISVGIQNIHIDSKLTKDILSILVLLIFETLGVIMTVTTCDLVISLCVAVPDVIIHIIDIILILMVTTLIYIKELYLVIRYIYNNHIKIRKK